MADPLVVKAVSAFGKGLIGPITSLISEFITDKDEAARLAHEIATMSERHAQEQLLAQIEVNKVQAAHKSMFVAGARPATMWICNSGLAYAVVIHPIADIWFEMPVIDTSLLYPVLMGLLGLGAYRSFEKSKGVAREQ